MKLGYLTEPSKKAFTQNRRFTLMDEGELLGSYDYLKDLYVVCTSHFYRSLVWMFIRTVPEPPQHDELDQIRFDTFMKEFGASQTIFSDTQLFPWQLYLIRGIPTGIDNHYIVQTRRIVTSFNHALRRLKDLYPKVQRSKTVSRESAELYLQQYPKHDPYGVTTRDLEVHYGHTGEQLQGKCEMRQAWKFNDLKPRFYYAQGGRDYFASRYIKKLAIALMDSYGTTSTAKRTAPELFLEPKPEQWITFWDFTAFTTSLSELKHYLYWICRALEDLGTYDLWVVDYHLGKICLDPVALLDSYNEMVNIQSPFTVHRIIDKFLYDINHQEFEQVNSGMLGVAGNIGMSTSCHGVVIGTVVGEDNSVCIGDDGEAHDDEDPHERLIPTMSTLGNIHVEKFQVIAPHDEGPAKFVKRGTFRDGNKLFIDFLYGLPISVYVDMSYDPRRTVNEQMTWKKRITKTVIAIGQLLWRIRDRYYESMPEEEYRALIKFLRTIYTRLRIPFRGGVLVPSLFYEDDPDSSSSRRHFPLIVPDLSGIDYRERDWLEEILAREPEGLVIPEYVGFYKVPVPTSGDRILLPRTKDMKVLEDMGYVEMSTVHNQITHWSQSNKRMVRQMVGRFLSGRRADLFQLTEVTFLKEIPDKFLFMFDLPAKIDYKEMYSGEHW